MKTPLKTESCLYNQDAFQIDPNTGIIDQPPPSGKQI